MAHSPRVRDEIDAFNLVNSIYPVSRETFDALERFRNLLELWQKKTNLVASDTIAEFWTRHVCDSIQCLSILPQANCWVDLGSGGGFPGAVIAIANRDRNERMHYLVESNNKKCAFLRTIARETGSNVSVMAERIESATEHLPKSRKGVNVVTARALAQLPQLLELSHDLLAQGSVGLFHKGRDFQREIQDCDGLWRFDLVIHRSRVEADSVLLEIRNPVRQKS